MNDEGRSIDTAITRGCLHPATGDVMRYFEEERIYSLQIESTLACPQGCRYCYAPADADRVRELPSDDIAAVLTSAAAMDVKAVDWLGGDPLVRGDWYDLALQAHDLGFVNNIWSSGIPLADPEVAEQAVAATEGGFISVHLDTLDPAVYARLHVGDAETKIQAILRGIENLQASGKPANELVNCITFTRPLAGDDLARTMRYFCEELGMAVCLTQMCTVGRARCRPEWVPTPAEIRDACRIRDATCYPGSPHSFETMDVDKFYCGTAVCVTVDGDVTPCSVIRKGFGNLRERTISEIVEEHRDELLFSGMRQPRPNFSACARCEQSSVCWGCRAMAYYETGDLLGPDPKCWRAVSGGEKEMPDISIGDVIAAYEGSVGIIWEMLMGEQLHVGGERETDILAEIAGVGAGTRVLDVLSGLGGPARHLARTYGATVAGLDATGRMVDEAVRRTADGGLDGQVTFRLGNALDMPFGSGTFDVVWGQDAWCYMTDKDRLIRECHRVTVSGGRIAFTDWIQTGAMSDEERQSLNAFMLFPSLETLDGYERMLQRHGFAVERCEDLSDDFAAHLHRYRDALVDGLKGRIVELFGIETFREMERGIGLWARAADEGKVGRGRFAGRKL